MICLISLNLMMNWSVVFFVIQMLPAAFLLLCTFRRLWDYLRKGWNKSFLIRLAVIRWMWMIDKINNNTHNIQENQKGIHAFFPQVFSAFDCMLERGLCSLWFTMCGFLYDPLSAFRITKNTCFKILNIVDPKDMAHQQWKVGSQWCKVKRNFLLKSNPG